MELLCYRFPTLALSPDLVLKSIIVVVSGGEDIDEADTSTSSCDEIVEVANQRPAMVTAEGCALSPEKVGELLAAMITRAACKAMKHICTKHAIKKIYTVHGLLLDRMTGAFHCKARDLPNSYH